MPAVVAGGRVESDPLGAFFGGVGKKTTPASPKSVAAKLGDGGSHAEDGDGDGQDVPDRKVVPDWRKLPFWDRFEP